MQALYPFIKNCGIDLQRAWDTDFDRSFIVVPIGDLGNILDSLGDEDGVNNISNMIVTTCKNNYDLSSLSANDVVYNYLTNVNNISKTIYDNLVIQINKNKEKITNCVYKDLTGRGQNVTKSKLFAKILKCIENEYQTYGLGGITVERFLCYDDPQCFGEESFTLSYFDELTH